MAKAFGRTSARSLHRRFFTVRRNFTEKEIAFFLNVDFVSHVALVAVAEEAQGPAVVGGGRYIVVEPGRAEIAFAIVDQYQGLGIGAILMRHLASIARDAGLKELIAEVLAENAPMLKVFRNCGLPMKTERAAGVLHVSLDLS